MMFHEIEQQKPRGFGFMGFFIFFVKTGCKDFL